MEIDLLRCYVGDALQAYEACLAGLEVPGSPSDLSALLRAARKGEIDRRGKVTTPEKGVYEYHVHGAGYTFKEGRTGKDIRFDVMPVGGAERIRFTAWDLYKYAASLGEPVTEASAASELRRLSAEEKGIVRVAEGPFEYYYCADVSSLLIPGGSQTGRREGRGSRPVLPALSCPHCGADLLPWA